jgi:hypothetical protein
VTDWRRTRTGVCSKRSRSSSTRWRNWAAHAKRSSGSTNKGLICPQGATTLSQRRDQVREALGRDLEAARYAADRAFRQYDAADSANRLVASELETRWNKALARVTEVEAKIAGHDAVTPSQKHHRSSSPLWLAISGPSGRLRRPMRGSRSASSAP